MRAIGSAGYVYQKRKGKQMMPNGAALDYDSLSKAGKRAAAMAAPKVSSAFLADMPKQLGMNIKPFCKELGISDPIFYKYRNDGECPDYVRAKAEAMAEKRGITLATADTIKPKPKRTPKADMVPSSFLDGIEEKLGVTQVALCEVLGMKVVSFQKYRQKGRCPIGLRTAINGLLAERKLQNGELTERKPRAPKAQLPVVSYAQPVPQTGDMVALYVMVPRDQVHVASAMLAACGYPIQVGR
jgi:hypothetical protein